MISIYIVAAFWFLAALVSTVIANRLKISMALMEIIIGTVIGFIAFKAGFSQKLALDADWMKLTAGLAAIMLTFLSMEYVLIFIVAAIPLSVVGSYLFTDIDSKKIKFGFHLLSDNTVPVPDRSYIANFLQIKKGT